MGIHALRGIKQELTKNCSAPITLEGINQRDQNMNVKDLNGG
ncbi:hypothetical protein C8J38_11520 [Rhizobium sp. PP-WC-2G-219]|nr:hypothetical protein DFI02_12125 [Rhizobium sp. PP-F2F-G20b]TCL89187.1 hypothetical protein C8J38_11520 [Rhizobium sp. PP-WC-2G-219]TCQ01865.1 hypothetical protein C8J34_12520 [Rhizobium sp. PP-F2F-G36]TCQ13148.1 hypothetical protein C8J33_1371 [Rhizobium sp. PP-CC-3G-465]